MSRTKVNYQELPEWGPEKNIITLSDSFLPKPAELVYKQKVKKITLVLDEESIDFFKEQAADLNTSYQRMIRNLLHQYSQRMKYQ